MSIVNLRPASLVLALALLVPVACGGDEKAGAPAPEPAKTPTAAPSVPTVHVPAQPAGDVRVRLVTTTSVQNSGLLPAILPEWEKASGVKVDVIAMGTGAAFKLARDGNADLLLVHDKKGEEQFIADGDGRERTEFLWNSFEILGPAADPAGVKGTADAADALKQIAAAGAPFVSRGDDSGTHRREKCLWEKAGGRPEWKGYREAGQAMGATLRIADEMEAYVLCDQGTRYGYQGTLRLTSLLADTPELRNTYSVVRLSATKHPHVRKEADALADWLLSQDTAKRIEEFKVGGQTLFRPLRSAPEKRP
jgi:tungstate transport system substrate-binding protein